MLGTIIGIEEETVLLKLSIDLTTFQSLINMHVVMEDSGKMLVGEIIDIKDGIAFINLVGEIVNNEFVFGVIKKPSFGAHVKLISREKIPMIISIPNYEEKKDVYIGESPIYPGVRVGFDINAFFANHFAIFGNSGSGKSWGTARVIQSIFEKQSTVAYRASIFIFDAYGEYHSAFKNITEKVPEVSFKSYTTNTKMSDSEVLKLPLWLLSVDDIALLLNAESTSQIPMIEKALKYVNLFVRDESEVIKEKNDIIARALLDILSSGKNSSQIRDQIFSVLSTYNTKDLNLESEIFQPGYTRSLKQCLIIDATGKIREMELITNFFSSFLNNDYELKMPDGSFKFGLKDLENAFNFALLSEGALSSDKVFDENNILKVRLHTLLSGDYAKYFECDDYVNMDDYIKSLLMAGNGRKAQIINFNINYVDDRFAKILTKIYSRLLFDYAKNMDKRATLPFHIILEEAHRYVQNDNDVNLLGYNIFDRITKEGRKYGVLLGLISQRPSDLSETSISQCSNFLIFKMLHPRDIGYIREMVPNITEEVVKRLRILQPGNCMAFGTAFKVPVLTKIDMPNPAPSSSSCDISASWFIDRN
ncbi:MAG: ATP-binding protein [Bacilli bacterium]|nr:ATP-binding protein [Bacilli bacterium]